MKFLDRFRKNNAPAELVQPDSLPVPTPPPVFVEPAQPVVVAPVVAEQGAEQKPEQEGEPKAGFFQRLKSGLRRTSSSFSSGLGNLFLGQKVIDDALFEELETQLLMADVGIDATQKIIANLTQRVSRKELADSDALYRALQDELKALIAPCALPLVIDPSRRPYVILVVGVNGAGKTTTIGKLAKRYQDEGKSVLLAAGDTFRAAAVEQLQAWGDRHNVPVIAQHTGADSASVLFDALQAAQARGADVLIADTAGRLHNKDNLMEELKKVVRVLRKLDPEAPHEVLLVLDAGTGQNALGTGQARQRGGRRQRSGADQARLHRQRRHHFRDQQPVQVADPLYRGGRAGRGFAPVRRR